MTNEPESLILQMLRDMRRDMATKTDMEKFRREVSESQAELESQIKSLRADFASDIHALDAKVDKGRKETGEQIVGLRRAVMEYHTSVIGHGILISEMEARMRRVEQHLDLPPLDAH